VRCADTRASDTGPGSALIKSSTRTDGGERKQDPADREREAEHNHEDPERVGKEPERVGKEPDENADGACDRK
jgi:hypothetical protein